MSNTHQVIYKKHRPNNRANIYGLCRCTMCRAGKYSFKAVIKRMKKKLRRDPEVSVGLYTD